VSTPVRDATTASGSAPEAAGVTAGAVEVVTTGVMSVSAECA
jgi:hypothetical protein